MRKLLVTILVVSLCTIWGQSSSNAYLNWYQTAEQNYNTENPTSITDSIALLNYEKVVNYLYRKKSADSVLWDAAVKAGILYQTQGKNAAAIPYFQKGIETQQTALLPDSVSFLPLLYAGNAYYFEQKFDSSVFYFEKAESLLNKHPGIRGRERLYNALGVLNYETGNYRQSSNYFQKALAIVETSVGTDPSLAINYRNNIAFCLKKLNRNQEALEVYLSLLKYRFNTEELYLNIASVYANLENYEQVLAYLKKIKSPSSISYNLYAKVYIKLHQPEKAEKALKQALELEQFQSGVNPGTTFRLLGDVYQQKGNFSKALEFYQTSIRALNSNFTDPDATKNPEDFRGVITSIDLYESLLSKALLLEQWHYSSNQPVYGEMSLATFKSMYRLANYLSTSYETDEAKLFLNEKKYISHDIPIQLAYQLYTKTKDRKYLDELFFFDEENKASVLNQELNASLLKKQSGIPDSLLSKESNAKKQLNQLGIQRSQATDSATIMSLITKMAETELLLENIQKQIAENPNYQTKAILSSYSDIKTIQGRLTQSDLILNYHLSNASIICTYITKDSTGVIEIKNKAGIVSNIASLLKLNAEVGKHSRQEYTNPIDTLSELLIQPYYTLFKNFQRWYIVPDDELSYLPFELLLAGSNTRLVDQHIITYNSSVALLMQPSRQVKNDETLAMAPFASEARGSFSRLPESLKELSSINGSTYFDTSATKEVFLSESKKYHVLHLATHAFSNEQDPQQSFIAFSSKDPKQASLLYLPEIYSLNLGNTDLTILSACETGTGQLIKGEGLISLSRAFAYAGCGNTITSQWKASDASTAYIMKRFHEYYSQSYQAAEALSLAKRDYLKDENVEARFKTPDFWANLRLTGIYERQRFQWKWLWLLACIPLLYWSLKFYKNKKAARTSRTA